jgi:hypothetical protein
MHGIGLLRGIRQRLLAENRFTGYLACALGAAAPDARASESVARGNRRRTGAPSLRSSAA